MRLIQLTLLLLATLRLFANTGSDTTAINSFNNYCSQTLHAKIDSLSDAYRKNGKLDNYTFFEHYNPPPDVNFLSQGVHGYQSSLNATASQVTAFKQQLTEFNNSTLSTYKVVYINLEAWDVLFRTDVVSDTQITYSNYKKFLERDSSDFQNQDNDRISIVHNTIASAFSAAPATDLLFIVNTEFHFWHHERPNPQATLADQKKNYITKAEYLSFYPLHYYSPATPQQVKDDHRKIYTIFFDLMYETWKKEQDRITSEYEWLPHYYSNIYTAVTKYKIYGNLMDIQTAPAMAAHFGQHFGGNSSLYKALSLQQTIHVLKVLAKESIDYNAANIIVNCINNCTEGNRKPLLDSIAFAKLYDGTTNLNKAIFYHISGNSLGAYLTATSMAANKAYPGYTNEVDAISDRKNLVLKPGGFFGSTIYNAIDNSTGKIMLANLSNNQLVLSHPFEKVLVTLSEDYRYRNFTWQRGESKNITALAAYALFNHESNQRLWQYLQTAVDVGLVFIGGAEIKLLFKAGTYIKAFRNLSDAKKLISGIMAAKGLVDVVLIDVVADVLRQSGAGQRWLEKYHRYTMWVDMGYLTTMLGKTALKKLYSEIKQESRVLVQQTTENGQEVYRITTVDETGNTGFRAITATEAEESRNFVRRAEQRIEQETGFDDIAHLDDAATYNNVRNAVTQRVDNLVNLRPGMLTAEERLLLTQDLNHPSGKELLAYLEKQTGNSFEQAVDAWKRVFKNNNVSDLRKDATLLKSVAKAAARLDMVVNSSRFSGIFALLKGMPATAGRNFRYANLENFKTRFIDLHLSQRGVNVKSIDDVAADFEHTINNHSNVTDIEKYIDEMEQTAEKFRGGAFGMEIIHSPPPELKNYPLRQFEASIDDIDDLCDASSKCRFDMKFSDGTNFVFVETKNYSKTSLNGIIGKDEFYNQFKAYISNPNLKKMDDIIYFFRKNDGIDEVLVKGKFQTLFKAKSQNLFTSMSEDLRKSLLGNADYLRYDKFLELVNNSNSQLYNFVKIK